MSIQIPTPGSLPSADFPSSVLSPLVQRGECEISVSDESITVPSGSPYTVELDYLPQGDLVIWTGAGQSGAQRSLVTTSTPAAGEVSITYGNGGLIFNSADAGGTLYATYTSYATAVTATKFNQIQAEIVAIETYLTSPFTVSAIWGSGTAEAFTMCYKYPGEVGGVPVVGACDPSDIDKAIPFGFLSSAATQGEIVTLSLLGKITGMTGLPDDGSVLVVGRNGKPSWESDSANYPYETHVILTIGKALTTTSMFLQIDMDQIYNVRR